MLSVCDCGVYVCVGGCGLVWLGSRSGHLHCSSFHSDLCVCVCVLSHPLEAEPSEEEQELHSRVADVLVRAPDILTNLQNYKGAGEKIREVSVCVCLIRNCQ